MKEIKCYKNTLQGLELVGVVDDYQSFTFTRKYADCGEWQLVLNGNTKNATLIKDMDYISMGDGVAGFVEQIESNVGENNQIIYTGGELKGITSSRIIMPPTNQSYLHIRKNPALVILDILNTQLVETEDELRTIPNVRIDTAVEVDETQKIEFNGRFGNVYEEIAVIANTYNIGWKADIIPMVDNPQYAEIVFSVYSGVDRKQSQSTNSRFILSYSNDNINQSNYQYLNSIPTTALVAGQGEGVERQTYLLGNAADGLNRKEVYIDARDIEDSTLLPQRGAEKLAEYGEPNSYQITLSQNLVKQYQKSFELGDIGTIHDELLGIVLDFRLTEITEIYEADDFRLEVVCGYDKKDLGSAIKRSSGNTQTLLKVEGGGTEELTVIEENIATMKTQITDISSQLNTTEAQISDINSQLSGIFAAIYPVGSIYMSINNVNPTNLFGGTWVAWGSGRVPMGVDTSQTEFNSVEKTGGEKVHTLTIDEMPSHTHTQWSRNWFVSPASGGNVAANAGKETTATGSSGSGTAHNNLQPYITCYMWKRTA